MTRVNFEIKELQSKWGERVKTAKKEFKNDRYRKEVFNVIEEIDFVKGLLQKNAEVALKEIETELASVEKPEEPKRIFDAETISVLNYYSKIIQSKIAGAADNQGSFLKTAEELAQAEDAEMRTAFVDSFHDILQAARRLSARQGYGVGESRDGFESRLREQLDFAKDSLLNSTQREANKNQAEKKRVLESERFEISFRLPMIQDVLEGDKSQYLSVVHYFSDDRVNKNIHFN